MARHGPDHLDLSVPAGKITSLLDGAGNGKTMIGHARTGPIRDVACNDIAPSGQVSDERHPGCGIGHGAFADAYDALLTGRSQLDEFAAYRLKAELEAAAPRSTGSSNNSTTYFAQIRTAAARTV
ncbi:hypothetical protein [Nocardia fluminea]|uniref:Uncharacterized protein n=1 Tax=Nocardia fluminea TaxID=134984 RepID=A0A2N3VHS0_9NOCA|nr:hypothetical protein [Nocardia fluminea]PKV81164.1 hypothetical protein ATK86_5626 [Nocardia fluminea]